MHMPHARLLTVIWDWEDTSVGTGEPVLSLHQGRGCQSCQPAAARASLALPGARWGSTSRPRCHPWGEIWGSQGAWAPPVPGPAFPCCVQPGTARGGRGWGLPHTEAAAWLQQPPAEMQMQLNGRCD